MLIDLGNGVMWDDSLAYSDHDQLVIEAVDVIMQGESVAVNNAVCGRCEQETWQRDGYAVVMVYCYLYPVTHRACYALSHQVIIVNTL